MPSDHPTLRIGDAERARHVAVLGEHFASGRLTMGEFETRVDATWAATTRGQLDDLRGDLPRSEPERVPTRSPSRSSWAPWAATGVICLLIWAITSLSQGTLLSFWPIWVIGPWGVVLLVGLLTGRGGCGRQVLVRDGGTRQRA